jgi:hypothetical protein
MQPVTKCWSWTPLVMVQVSISRALARVGRQLWCTACMPNRQCVTHWNYSTHPTRYRHFFSWSSFNNRGNINSNSKKEIRKREMQHGNKHFHNYWEWSRRTKGKIEAWKGRGADMVVADHGTPIRAAWRWCLRKVWPLPPKLSGIPWPFCPYVLEQVPYFYWAVAQKQQPASCYGMEKRWTGDARLLLAFGVLLVQGVLFFFLSKREKKEESLAVKIRSKDFLTSRTKKALNYGGKTITCFLDLEIRAIF